MNNKRKKKKLHFSPYFIRNWFWSARRVIWDLETFSLLSWPPHPTKIWFYTETLNEQHSFILTLCDAMYICTGRFSAGLCVWLTTFISTKVPCKFRFCRFDWCFHRNRDNTMTSMLEKWGRRGQFLQLWSWIGSSWSKNHGAVRIDVPKVLSLFTDHSGARSWETYKSTQAVTLRQTREPSSAVCRRMRWSQTKV